MLLQVYLRATYLRKVGASILDRASATGAPPTDGPGPDPSAEGASGSEGHRFLREPPRLRDGLRGEAAALL